MNNGIKEKAICSDNLSNRYAGNQIYGKKDFSLWCREIIDGLQYSNVLDICCGTGNQLVLYSEKKALTEAWGVDLSQESLDCARERLKEKKTEVHLIRSNIDDFFDTIGEEKCFDLISCFYGLYYSENTATLLEKALNHLNTKGRMLIVGPYGKNNLNLFSILERYYTLPEIVTWSSNHYMEEEVLPILEKNCVVEQRDFVNEIEYPNSVEIMKYLKSSTFYSPEYEKEVLRDFEKEFAQYGKFVVEKHVKAYIASKQ